MRESARMHARPQGRQATRKDGKDGKRKETDTEQGRKAARLDKQHGMLHCKALRNEREAKYETRKPCKVRELARTSESLPTAAGYPRGQQAARRVGGCLA